MPTGKCIVEFDQIGSYEKEICCGNGRHLLLLLILTVWLFWPVPNAAQNDLAGVTITAGQEESAQQYALGLLYAEAGDWAAAQEQYAEAVLSTQPEIQQASRLDYRVCWQLKSIGA